MTAYASMLRPRTTVYDGDAEPKDDGVREDDATPEDDGILEDAAPDDDGVRGRHRPPTTTAYLRMQRLRMTAYARVAPEDVGIRKGVAPKDDGICKVHARG